MKHYKHKDKDVICELIGKQLRFSKWKWHAGKCLEEYSYKDLTPEFHNSFDEITMHEFNDIWGAQLQKA